jgi:hypothetical protein
MAVDQSEAHGKAVALALYQVRVLLSGYLGSQATGDISVRQAAHLAYALHNEALAILEGGSFDAVWLAGWQRWTRCWDLTSHYSSLGFSNLPSARTPPRFMS